MRCRLYVLSADEEECNTRAMAPEANHEFGKRNAARSRTGKRLERVDREELSSESPTIIRVEFFGLTW
jgi:hypothetical protein